MTLGAGQVRSLLDRYGISPSRALGQNFLIDPNTARRIAAAAGAGAGTRVLEIGPGLGSLTLALAEAGATVTAVELDKRLAPAVAEVTAEAGHHVAVVQGDALDVDLAALAPGPEPWRLAANLPYNVGTQIFLRILETVPAVTGGVVLVQREVADRLAAGPGDSAYGIPSVKSAWWARCRVAGRVPATVFHPRPRVDSAFVAFERHDPPGDEAVRTRVFELIDSGFGQRRKMLRRSLAGMVDVAALAGAGIAETARAEELTVDDWVRLAEVAP